MKGKHNLVGVATALLITIGICLDAQAGETNNAACGPSDAFPSLRTGEHLAIIGVRQNEVRLDEAKKKSLQQPMVGLGITERIAQSFADTGKFILLESDVQFAPILEGLVRSNWLSREKEYSVLELSEVASQLGVKALAYGSVSYSASSGDDWGIFIFTERTETLHIGIRVCLYEATGNAPLCCEGHGEAQRKETAFVYEPRDDNRGFMGDMVGIATTHAVTQAVRDLIAALHFSP
jgi:hypothetical protein